MCDRWRDIYCGRHHRLPGIHRFRILQKIRIRQIELKASANPDDRLLNLLCPLTNVAALFICYSFHHFCCFVNFESVRPSVGSDEEFPRPAMGNGMLKIPT